MGTPEEIYQNPVTAFVARFTGLAGELDVRVHDRVVGGKLRARLGDRLVAARAPRPLTPGMPALLAVRPSAGTLVASSDERADLLGVVRDVAFRGRGYEHVVDLAGGGRLHSLFSELKWRREERVGVKLDSEQCLLLGYEPAIEHVDSGGAGLEAVVAATDTLPPGADGVFLEGIG
jgi:iron(III) transport system ATP-binding protein